MASFATPQDLADYLIRPLDEAEQAAAPLLLRLASASVALEVRQTVEKVTTTAKLAGTWSQDLELPERPVVDVTAVAVNGVNLPVGAYTWNSRTLLRRGVALDQDSDGFSPVDVDEHRQGASGASTPLHWGGPASTVEVTYEHGYDADVIPDVFVAVTLSVAARVLESPTGITSESLGGYSVTYAGAAEASFGGSHAGGGAGFTLTAAERALLRPYRKRAHHAAIGR